MEEKNQYNRDIDFGIQGEVEKENNQKRRRENKEVTWGKCPAIDQM